MMPRKLDDTARGEIEDVALQRAAIPSDNDLAQKHNVSRSLIQHVMRLARRKAKPLTEAQTIPNTQVVQA